MAVLILLVSLRIGSLFDLSPFGSQPTQPLGSHIPHSVQAQSLGTEDPSEAPLTQEEVLVLRNPLIKNILY